MSSVVPSDPADPVEVVDPVDLVGVVGPVEVVDPVDVGNWVDPVHFASSEARDAATRRLGDFGATPQRRTGAATNENRNSETRQATRIWRSAVRKSYW